MASIHRIEEKDVDCPVPPCSKAAGATFRTRFHGRLSNNDSSLRMCTPTHLSATKLMKKIKKTNKPISKCKVRRYETGVKEYDKLTKCQ